MTNPQPVRDRFAAPEYCNPLAKLPIVQSLRGENPAECGFFVSLDQMGKASWLNIPETLDSYTFSSGAIEKGLIFRQPRMLVIPKSGLLAARSVKGENGSSELELLGKYGEFKGQAGSNSKFKNLGRVSDQMGSCTIKHEVNQRGPTLKQEIFGKSEDILKKSLTSNSLVTNLLIGKIC